MNPKAEQYKAYLLQEFNKRQGKTAGVVSPVPETENPLPERKLSPVGNAYMNTTNAITGMKNRVKSAVSALPRLATRVMASTPVSPVPDGGAQTVSTPPTPTGTPMPTPIAGNPIHFDYEKYRTSGNFTLKQPPPEIAKTLLREIPNDATRAAIIAGTESGFRSDAYNFNPNATGAYKNSGDYGLMQINDVTMKDYQRRYPKEMARVGIRTVEDLKDLTKAVRLAKIILEKQGARAWYGPKNRGFTLE